MSFLYDSKNKGDNELRKFQPDSAGNVAVNVKSQDILDSLSMGVFQLINCCGLLNGIPPFVCIVKTTDISGNNFLDYKNAANIIVRRLKITYGPNTDFSICIIDVNIILTEDDEALLTEDDQPIELE